MPDNARIFRSATVRPRPRFTIGALSVAILSLLFGCGSGAAYPPGGGAPDEALGCLVDTALVARPVEPPTEAATLIARPDSAPALRVVLNIPAFRLDVVDRDGLRASYPVAVGTARYPTPEGEYTIDWLEWNPWWIPPPSDWARDEKPTPPGPANPMGRVKIHVTGFVLLHGTPDRASIGRPASHACIRMLNEHAVELASTLQRAGASHLGTERLDAAARGTRTLRVPFDRPIPTSFVYELAEVRDTMLLVHRDIYRRSRTPYSTLIRDALAAANAGFEPGAQELEALARRAERESVSVPLRALAASGET